MPMNIYFETDVYGIVDSQGILILQSIRETEESAWWAAVNFHGVMNTSPATFKSDGSKCVKFRINEIKYTDDYYKKYVLNLADQQPRES